MSANAAARMAEAMMRYRECLDDAARAHHQRERQALEAQADLCLKVMLELQEQAQARVHAVAALPTPRDQAFE